MNSIHTERLTIRISKQLLEQAKQKARDKEISLSAYVRTIVKNEIKKGENYEKLH